MTEPGKREKAHHGSKTSLRPEVVISLIGRVTLVLWTLMIVCFLLLFVLWPMVMFEARGRGQVTFSLDQSQSSGIEVVIDLNVPDESPTSTLDLKEISLSKNHTLQSCPQALLIAVGRGLLLSTNEMITDMFSESEFSLSGWFPIPGDPSTHWSGAAPMSVEGVGKNNLAYVQLPGLRQCNEWSSDPRIIGRTITAREATLINDVPPLMTDIPGFVKRPGYLFPFDRYEFFVSAELIDQHPFETDFATSFDSNAPVFYSTSESADLFPDVELNVTAPAWEAKVNFGTIESSERIFPLLVLQRPLAQRSLAVALLVAILSVMVLIPFVRDVGSTLEITVGILFSLWGVHSILVPGFITRTTIVDHAILALYLLLGLMLFIRFAIIPAWRRLGVAPATAPNTPLPSAPLSLTGEGRGEGEHPTPTQHPPVPPPAAPPHSQPAAQPPVPEKGRASSIPRLVAAAIATIAAVAGLIRLFNRTRKP